MFILASTGAPGVELRSILFDKDGDLHENVAKEIIKNVKGKAKKGLTKTELKLTGSLLKTILKCHADKNFESLKVATIPVPNQRAITLSQLPATYKKVPDTTPNAKRVRKSRDRKIIKDFMKLLPDDALREQYIEEYIGEHSTFAVRIVKKNYPKYFRLSVNESSSAMVFAGINPYKLKKLSRALRHITGLFTFAPMDSIANEKARFWDTRYLTRLFTDMKLERTIKSKGKPIQKEVTVCVMTIRPLEHLLLSSFDLLSTNRWVSSEKRFSAWFEVHPDFDEKCLIKIGIDAGGNSTKYIQNIVNVAKPQGRENIDLVGEFDVVKDTAKNVMKAFFTKGSKIRQDMEDICQRRTVILHLVVAGKVQTIIAVNSDPKHNINAPNPLPKLDGASRYCQKYDG